MKKFLTMVAIFVSLGTFASFLPLPSEDFSPVFSVSAKSSKKSKKESTMSKKKRKQKEKNTKERLKRLRSMGISQSFAQERFGTYLSLADMGKIIGDWIVEQYNETGQIALKTGKNTSDWLVLNVNGQCLSSSEVCARWQ